MDLKGINICNKELFRLIKRYKIKLDNLGSSQGLSKAVTYLYRVRTPNSTFASTFYNKPTRQTSIALNEYWWATPAKREFFKKSMEKCVEVGYHKIATFKGVIAHEYGHVLDIAKKFSSSDEVIFYLRGTSKIEIKNIFGEYANREPAEFFAEAFCNYEAKNLPKGAMSFMKRLLRKYIVYLK